MIGPSTSIAARPHRGMFQRPGPPVPDGSGYTQSWIDLPPAVDARVNPATQAALERLAQGTVVSMATHIVTVPYRDNLTTQCRFVLDGRNLSVLGIYDADERHAELNLICAEMVQ